MPDYDFIPFIAFILILALAVGSIWVPLTLSPATYDGLDHKGDSGLVIAGSGNEPAEVAGPEKPGDGQEVDSENADQLHITSEATEEAPTADNEQQGLVIKIVLEDDSTTAPLWIWVLCAISLLVMVGIAVGIWILVRKEFGHG